MSECACKSGVTLIYSCSGAADVGEISDRAARQLRREGFVQGSCIAGLGAGLSGYIQSAKGADTNIIIDGCPVACGRKILENAGITPVSHIVTEMGFKKGSTHVTPEVIEEVCNTVRQGKPAESKPAAGDGCGCGGSC